MELRELEAEPIEPAEVDAIEVPSGVDLALQGGGLRSARARALERERRLGPGRPAGAR